MIDWADAHEEEETSVYEAKQKELEQICNPIMTRVYQKSAGSKGAEQNPATGPSVEEVD